MTTYRVNKPAANLATHTLRTSGRRTLTTKADVACEQDIYDLSSAVDAQCGRFDVMGGHRSANTDL